MPRPDSATDRGQPRPPQTAPGSAASAGGGQPASPRLGLPLHLTLAAAGAALVGNLVIAAWIGVMPGLTPGPWGLLALTALIDVAAASVALWLAGGWLGRRVARISAVLECTQNGDYSQRVVPGPHDDIGVLARQVNALVSASANREKRIMESALSDPLTGLPNRTLLSERIRHSLAISRRSRTPFGVVVIDLDRFKAINDTLGHATGDTVLCEVARRLRAAVREVDTVARLGGDEFVLLLAGGEDAVTQVTQRIVEAMRSPMMLRDQRVDIGLSIGVAMHPQHGEDDLALLRNADTAMYRAKRRRAGVVIFDGESHETRRSYLSMLGEMRTALETGQFVLDYQPKLELLSGRVIGIEGLIRWNHPSRGRVAPSEFIPFAEQTGFMRELTRWVVQEGAHFARGLTQRGLDLRVSLNVSAHDIENPTFSQIVAEALRTLQLDPSRLCLEVTESGLVSETDNALSNLQTLAAMGIGIAVDDFGTGYSTLKQLQQLPVHEIKIDRSFVSGMNLNRGNQTIVRATIGLAKQLGLRATAEGVETVAELRTLAAMGCDEVQGYYVAKPMLAHEVFGWIEARRASEATSRRGDLELLVDP
jgi:diguanylate cyclase (GGDEF)-like protein